MVVLVLMGCTAEARKDLPVEHQDIISTDMTVFLSPDQFPNVAFRCNGPTGIYINTRDADEMQIVPNDLACEAPR